MTNLPPTQPAPALEELPARLRKGITKAPSPISRSDALTAADRDPLSPCWLYGKTNNAGYGQVKWRNKVWNTHRLVWHLLVSPLDQPGKSRALDGRVLDHLCEVRACCNPHHLELISQSDNTKRGGRHRA